MEGPGLYVTDLPQNRLRSPGSITSRLIYFILPALVVALVAGSLYWLQWTSHLGITLGYPTPRVYITSTVSNPLMVHDTAQFSARANGRDITYVWDFGDGTSGSGATVNHNYESNGSFTVTVRASDPINQTSTDQGVRHSSLLPIKTEIVGTRFERKLPDHDPPPDRRSLSPYERS